MARIAIAEFGTIQKALAGASVAIYKADVNGASTGVLATLYLDATNPGTTGNPQTLDADGKLAQSCFVDTIVIAAISNISATTARAIRKITVNPTEYPLPITSAEIATAIIADSVTAAATATTQAGIATTQAGIATAGAAAATAVIASASSLSFSPIGTSVTANTVGTGAKTWTTQANLGWVAGATRIRVATADASKIMEGAITAYSGTSVTVNVDYTVGSGSSSAWNITTVGSRGASGAGAGDLVSTNNLSDIVSASAARANLGLVIGTNVQAYDSELAALAGLTSAASKIPYFTGSATAGLLSLDTDNTLAANSDTALATQKAVKAYVLAHAGGGSALQPQMTAFLVNGTFTTSANITSATRFKFTLIGGGGGGGGNNNAAGQKSSGGGGAGATCIYETSGLSPNTAYTISVGTGGAGGSTGGGVGANGGTSSAVIGATTPTAGGGTGGYGAIQAGNNQGGPGGIASNGTINITGGDGDPSSYASSNYASGGSGGASSMGGGGAGGTSDAGNPSNPGKAYGSGGAGNASAGLGTAGGAGKSGIVIVEWFE